MLSGPKTNSLERLVPGDLSDNDSTGRETYEFHLARYDYAAGYVNGGRVLDCACGVGYGSARLAELAKGQPIVKGVDIDADAIGHAMSNYASQNVSFSCCDGSKYDDEPFDTVICFETIEHVPNPDALIANLARLLKQSGTFIASVPITPSVDVNPFHLHDFSRRSFIALFRRHGLEAFDSIIQTQKWNPLTMLRGEEVRLHDMRKGLLKYWATHPSAVLKRGYSTVVDGFCNKYMICAFKKVQAR